MKPLKRISTIWSAKLAYCIGLIASDGNLSKDGRHLTLVSKDHEQLETFKESLGITANIRPHGRGSSSEKDYFRLQFGDVFLYKFLLSVGLTPKLERKYQKVYNALVIDEQNNSARVLKLVTRLD